MLLELNCLRQMEFLVEILRQLFILILEHMERLVWELAQHLQRQTRLIQQQLLLLRLGTNLISLVRIELH